MTIDFKKQDLRPKERDNFKKSIYEAIQTRDVDTGDFKRKKLLVVNL